MDRVSTEKSQEIINSTCAENSVTAVLNLSGLSDGLYLRAVAPGSKRPSGVLVLSSHADDVPLGFEVDLKLVVVSVVELCSRRGDLLKTNRCFLTLQRSVAGS